MEKKIEVKNSLKILSSDGYSIQISQEIDIKTNQKKIMNKQEQYEKINELEEKNKLLTETFLQSEEKINKLEEEIELLKIKKIKIRKNNW